MLQTIALIDRDEFEFVAIAPPGEPLAGALAEHSIRHVPVDWQNESGQRFPRDIACDNLVAAIEQASPDLVHANSLAMGRLTGAIAQRLNVPTIAHLRDIIKLSGAAIEDLNRNAALIAVSNATKDHHVQQQLDPDRTRVIYNGVDCDRFQPRPSTGFLRRELGLPNDASIALTIGQIGLRKGQDVLANAAPAVFANVHFVIVGERNSSKAESIEFEKLIAQTFDEAGLGNQLHCIGYRHDVDRLLNEADMLVHPAKQEPLGRVLLEAAAAGLPIIATSVGGTPEILTDGVSACLVSPSDADELARAINALAIDDSERHRLAAAARKKIVEKFSAQTAADNLRQLWHEMS